MPIDVLRHLTSLAGRGSGCCRNASFRNGLINGFASQNQCPILHQPALAIGLHQPLLIRMYLDRLENRNEANRSRLRRCFR
jgi:hypothetical protein